VVVLNHGKKKEAQTMDGFGRVMLNLIWIVILVLLTVRGSCTRNEDAVYTAEVEGYSEVIVLDRDWFMVGFRGCDVEDAAKFEIKAVNVKGVKVEIIVCMGYPFKAGTVRVPIH